MPKRQQLWIGAIMSGYEDYRLSKDTTAEAEQVLFELLSKKSPAEKLRMVSQMNATVRTLTMSGLRDRYPNESDLLERRTLQVVAKDPEQSAYVASVEDLVLAKLDWYRQGNEVSEQQWRDVVGIFKANQGRLDLDYFGNKRLRQRLDHLSRFVR